MVKTTYAQRLAAALEAPEDKAAWTKDHRTRIKALAAHLGVTPNAVVKYFNDGSKAMSAPNNSRTARFLRVDPDWLATGEGEMRGKRAWPFGDAVTPADFFCLDEGEVRPALDVLVAAVDRRRAAGSRPSGKPSKAA